MITLEQEAEELYPDNEYPIFGEELRSAFIDGSKSKYVEREKIKYQINFIESIIDKYYFDTSAYLKIKEDLNELKIKLDTY